MYEDVRGFHIGGLLYGGWHHHLSMKMVKYGLDEYVALKDSTNYVHSFDLDGVPDDFKYPFNSSLPIEERIKK